MSNALHELTITLLKRQHEQELLKVKEERDKFMKKYLHLEIVLTKLTDDNTRLKRQLLTIYERVDDSRDALKEVLGDK